MNGPALEQKIANLLGAYQWQMLKLQAEVEMLRAEVAAHKAAVSPKPISEK